MRSRIFLTVALLSSVGAAGAGGAVGAPPNPPTVITPDSVRVLAHSYAGAEARFSVSVRDWRGRELQASCTPSSGTRFPLGRTVVSCSATDRRGVTTTRKFPVTTTMLWAPASGARVTEPPVLRWTPISGASHYNVQLYRGTTKVLSAWPTRPRRALGARWVYEDRSYRLRAATYRWYVWPCVNGRYGRALGVSTFSLRLP